MTVSFKIQDGEGSGLEAGVTKDHALKVAVYEASSSDVPVEVITRYKIFRGFLEHDKSKDLNVDGSVTPVEFAINSEVGVIKWITKIRLLFNDTNMELDTNDFRRFGSAAVSPGLTNGIELIIKQGGLEAKIFESPVKTSGDFMAYTSSFVNFINAIDAQTDFLSFDVIPEKEIPIVEGSVDGIVCRINDDLTSLGLFQILLFGYKEVF